MHSHDDFAQDVLLLSMSCRANARMLRVITLANHKGHIHVADAKGGKTCAIKLRLVLVLLPIG